MRGTLDDSVLPRPATPVAVLERDATLAPGATETPGSAGHTAGVDLDGELLLAQAEAELQPGLEAIDRLRDALRAEDEEAALWWGELVEDLVARLRASLLVQHRQRVAGLRAHARAWEDLRPRWEEWRKLVRRLKAYVRDVLEASSIREVLLRFDAHARIETALEQPGVDPELQRARVVLMPDASAFDDVVFDSPAASARVAVAREAGLSPSYVRRAQRLARRLVGLLPEGVMLAHRRPPGPRAGSGSSGT